MRSKLTLISRAQLFLAALLAPAPLAAQTDVLTRHNDNARSGANLNETRLNTSNVNSEHFGKLAYRIVDGNVYAQPLVITQARIDGRAAATNAVIVATEHNSVYALDAEDTNQASTTFQLWHKGSEVFGKAIDSRELYTRIGKPECSDLTTEFGITSTPVIKITRQEAPKEGVVFIVAKSKATNNKYIYKLFALSLANGQEISEAIIQGEVRGSGIGSTGSGANGKIRFDPLYQLNRPALLLNGDTLFIAFGGHCDQGPYHGWVFAFDVSNPKTPKKLDVFCSTPNGKGSPDEGRAGIWMSGEGPATDDAGNIYFVTGDGTYNATTDFGDSVLKTKLSAGKIQVNDWYTPHNQETLKKEDVDLGSGGAVLLPNSHLLLTGGKEGLMFLIDRDHFGKGAIPALHSFRVTHGPEMWRTPPLYYNIHGTPVIWPRPGEIFVYINGEEDPLKQYRLISDTAPGGNGWKFESDTPFKSTADCPAKPNCVSAPFPNFPNGLFGQKGRDPVWMPGGFLSLSANGGADGSGILWVSMPYAGNANLTVTRGVLRALDASDVSKPELWDSENTGNENDRLGQFAKFCPPTVANGKVYVATFQQEIILNGVHSKAQGGDQPALVIYGLR